MSLNESGYTLIEMLLTLSILSILLLISTITLPSLSSNNHEADLIAKQIKEQILLAQHVALTSGRDVTVRPDNNTKEFIIRYHTGDVYLVIPFQHPDMVFESNTLILSAIRFVANGHPRQTGSFLMHIGKNRYQYTIYIGKGMVSYRKM
ncbi:competence type IV pilus minor pilin ComGD [Alkalihalobacillus sp. MEB130]|uniref:competence type IV pilus minor pilin ComGD n=1 Tax=Alkalihalobacillus sp. MEB130 TaxID=2976704 RepID=UPI0028E09105|nr:competence type IV pilus minor pilin ComGD [Alkalihalobacillus sp. MEB130]MDT8863030.1 competence type IV pilus minor pilin ComGD [Alkalihalobacillus sp. MEB130]